MTWSVARNEPGVVHVLPSEDQFEHVLDSSGHCWCGAWKEAVEGGVIVHHLDLSERVQLVLEQEVSSEKHRQN